jgi:hypothetical protein
MTDALVKTLIKKRNKMRAKFRVIDAELSQATGEWSRANGYLVKLTPEQVLRELERTNA